MYLLFDSWESGWTVEFLSDGIEHCISNWLRWMVASLIDREFGINGSSLIYCFFFTFFLGDQIYYFWRQGSFFYRCNVQFRLKIAFFGPQKHFALMRMRIRIRLFTLASPHQSDSNLRPLVYKPSRVSFCDPPRLHGPTWLNFKPLKLLNFDSGSSLLHMRIRIQLPKIMQIRLRNPAQNEFRKKLSAI